MSSLVYREREGFSKFGKYHWFQYLELWHTSGLRHGHTMATTTLGLTGYSVLINIKCLKWSSIHINDVVLIGRSKTELFWYRKMAHFAIKLPRYNFPLNSLNSHIFGIISKDLNMICVHLSSNICVYNMCDMFKSGICWLYGFPVMFPLNSNW